MTSRNSLSLLILWAIAAPGYAADGLHRTEDPTPIKHESPASTSQVLPRSMVPQGVIGHISLPEGVAILPPRILNEMRARLILQLQETKQ